MKNINNFGKAFVSNKAVIECRNFPIIIGIILFLIVTALISTPFYVARYSLSEVTTLEGLDGLTPSLEQMFQSVDCGFDLGVLACDAPSETYGKYTYYFQEEAPIPQADYTVYFGSESVSIQAAGPEKQLVGTYQTFGNTSFHEIYELMQSEGSESIALLFVKNLLLSGMEIDMVMIYMTNLLQNLTYLFLASLMFLFTNVRHKKSQTVKTTFNMAVYAMVGPAMLVALLSMYSMSIASIIFPVLYMARATFIYMRLIKAPKINIGASILSLKER